MLNYCDFIQVFIFTTNHHLNQELCLQLQRTALKVRQSVPTTIYVLTEDTCVTETMIVGITKTKTHCFVRTLPAEKVHIR